MPIYMIKLSHEIDIRELLKILPKSKLERENDINYVNVPYGDEYVSGKMKTYEDGRIIYEVGSELIAKRLGSRYLDWFRKNGFIILDENSEVIRV